VRNCLTYEILKLRYIHIVLLLLATLTLAAQEQHVGVRRRLPKQEKKEDNTKINQRMQELNERAHGRLTSGMSMSPDQYEDTIRKLFREDRWQEAEPLLVSAEREWGGKSNISCLIGRYWYHEGNADLARRYLLLALEDDSSNSEALEILVRLEENEENYATAIVHLNDLLGISPYNIRLWRKKIEIYRQMGNDIEADRLLERLAVIYPDDAQIKKDLIYRKELEAVRLSKQGNEYETQQALHDLIIRRPRVAQYYLDLSSSLLKEGKQEEALAICAKGVNNTWGNRVLIKRRVAILQEMARYQEAETYIDECIRKYGTMGLSKTRDYLRIEAAFAADENDAYTRHKRLYAETKSDEALEWLISTSMQRGWWDDAQYYLIEKERRKGRDKRLLSKRYTVEKRLGNDRAASRILEDLYLMDTTDIDTRELLAEKRLHEATDLMQEEMWEQALVPLRQANVLSSDSDMLAVLERRIRTCESLMPVAKDSLDQLQHSEIYEKEHNLDSAYACLMRYKPSLDEFHDVQRHRYTLLSKLQKNTLVFDYQFARRSSVNSWNQNAHVTYSRSFEHDAFDAIVGYAGRETAFWTEKLTDTKDTTYSTGGGSGFELGGAYYHYFDWGDVNASATWASKFFPKVTAKLSVTENLPMNWTLSERLQWRYIVDDSIKYHVYSTGASADWTSENGFILTPTVDLFLMQGKVYANGGLKMIYLPLEGDRSSIFTSFSAGNAPDLTLLDSNMPVEFAHLNTSLSAGGFYLINGHFGLAGSVDWYVMGSNDNTVRNYIYLHASLSIFF